MRLEGQVVAETKPEAGFLVAVLDVGTIFEVKLQCVKSTKYVILTSGIRFLGPSYSRKLIKHTFILGSGPGHDLGSISEMIKNPPLEV